MAWSAVTWLIVARSRPRSVLSSGIAGEGAPREAERLQVGLQVP